MTARPNFTPHRLANTTGDWGAIGRNGPLPEPEVEGEHAFRELQAFNRDHPRIVHQAPAEAHQLQREQDAALNRQLERDLRWMLLPMVAVIWGVVAIVWSAA